MKVGGEGMNEEKGKSGTKKMIEEGRRRRGEGGGREK